MGITGVVGQRPDTLLMLLREGERGREGRGKEGGGREGGRGREGGKGEGREGGRWRVHYINTQHPVPRTPWCTW